MKNRVHLEDDEKRTMKSQAREARERRVRLEDDEKRTMKRGIGLELPPQAIGQRGAEKTS